MSSGLAWFEAVAAHVLSDPACRSLDDPVWVDPRNGDVIRLGDVLPAEEPTPEERVLEDARRREVRDKIRSVLSEREAYCLREYYLHERRLRDVGDDLGLCRERVRQILLAARRKLARALGIRFSYARNHYHTGRRNLVSGRR